MRALILLCPLLFVLAFFDVLGAFEKKPLAETSPEPSATHVSLENDLPTGHASFMLSRLDPLSTQPSRPMKIALSIDGVEIWSNVVEPNSDTTPTYPPQDI